MSDNHLDRKDLKTPDAFFQGGGTANRFYHEHRTPRIRGTIAIVACFLGVVSWRASRNAAAESAAAAFLRATDAVEESSPESARSALQTVAESGEKPYGALTGLYLAELELKGANGSYSCGGEIYLEFCGEADEACETQTIQGNFVTFGATLEDATFSVKEMNPGPGKGKQNYEKVYAECSFP